MALFDFPRIHFKGNIDIHVPTINNSYYFPLTIYDQTRSKAFLPPRLYFSNAQIPEQVNAKIKPTVVPDPDNGYFYIEISPINTIDLLRTWCMTPLGSNPESPDADYVPFYQAADNDLGVTEGSTIMNNCPGYWNMYGDMSVAMSGVEVTGVQTCDGAAVTTWTNASPNLPADIAKLLNAAFDLDTMPASGITTALMVETISSQSVYANIFCSRVNLYDKTDTSQVYLSAKPFRFAAMLYGTWRVMNWWPAMSGSARFCSTILLDDLGEEDQAGLTSLLAQHAAYDGRTLKGLFVSFTILEVFENRYNQNIYQGMQPIKNPAQASTIGSITPWYDDDMTSAVYGRNLISLGMGAVYTNTGIGQSVPVKLTPAVASLRQLSNGNAIFSVDMGNTWPEWMTPAYQAGVTQPAQRGDASFSTFNLGNLSFRYGADPSTAFANLPVDPVNNPLSKVAESGCIFDFLITDPNTISQVQNNFIQVYATINGNDTQVLNEAAYMIATDQRGLYAEQGDNPADGYMVYNKEKVPCQLRIFQRGVKVTTPINILVAEYIVPEAANDPLAGPDHITTQSLADQSAVQLASGAVELNNNAVYYFVYDGQYPNNQVPPFTSGGYTIMDTGSFCCLRIHPKIDYSRYIDPSHPDYTAPGFEVIYEEIFKMYDVAYPAMAVIHPFTKQVWNNGTMAGLVLQRTDVGIWEDIQYMPRSRELSESQRALLQAWAKTFQT